MAKGKTPSESRFAGNEGRVDLPQGAPLATTSKGRNAMNTEDDLRAQAHTLAQTKDLRHYGNQAHAFGLQDSLKMAQAANARPMDEAHGLAVVYAIAIDAMNATELREVIAGMRQCPPLRKGI